MFLRSEVQHCIGEEIIGPREQRRTGWIKCAQSASHNGSSRAPPRPSGGHRGATEPGETKDGSSSCHSKIDAQNKDTEHIARVWPTLQWSYFLAHYILICIPSLTHSYKFLYKHLIIFFLNH